MMYTVTTQFRTDRLYSITNRIDAQSPKEAKYIAFKSLIEKHPNALDIRQRAQKSHKE